MARRTDIESAEYHMQKAADAKLRAARKIDPEIVRLERLRSDIITNRAAFSDDDIAELPKMLQHIDAVVDALAALIAARIAKAVPS